MISGDRFRSSVVPGHPLLHNAAGQPFPSCAMPIGAVVVLWAWTTALPGLTGQAPCRHGFPSSAKWLPEEHILPEADVVRARTARPHDSSPVLAPAHASVSSTINAWLEAHLPLQNLANCQDFTLLELDALVLDLAAASSAQLDEMYLQKGDRRALRHDNASGYAREWELQQHLLNRLPPVRCQCHLCRPMSSAADCCCLAATMAGGPRLRATPYA